MSKHYYFLYGTTPSSSLNDAKVAVDSRGYTYTVTMKMSGIVRWVDGTFQIIRKGFEGEKVAEKLMPKYFENKIDGKIFESAFLQSEKNSLLTERKVEIVLPKGSEYKLGPTFFSEREPTKWEVNMGGGTTYKAELTKTDRGVILNEAIITNGGAPKNLLDKESVSRCSKYSEITQHFR